MRWTNNSKRYSGQLKTLTMIVRCVMIFPPFFFLTGCQGYYCNDFEIEMKNRISSDKPKAKISLTTYDDLAWDELYIIKGPRFQEDVERIMWFESFDRNENNSIVK